MYESETNKKSVKCLISINYYENNSLFRSTKDRAAEGGIIAYVAIFLSEILSKMERYRVNFSYQTLDR